MKAQQDGGGGEFWKHQELQGKREKSIDLVSGGSTLSISWIDRQPDLALLDVSGATGNWGSGPGLSDRYDVHLRDCVVPPFPLFSYFSSAVY